MQIQIRRVAKTCSEFAARMEEVETRISHLEDEAGSQQVTREAMEKQLEDTQWKLTDLEDRLRCNNLRVLGIPEGVEGSDAHSFMVALFKEALPDLQQWDWDREIQRAHRFPFNRAGSNPVGKQSKVVLKCRSQTQNQTPEKGRVLVESERKLETVGLDERSMKE
ncbi:hypothetical protein NDU88_004089 [Pleurodeles waltl]|uniref:Uncharacterized protein n=1 Tax=Pleurodeles waltl TaxID=8319 RepID=A0AAV7NID3_PLEWA|nr:hypothetical protein NDU88_004089 [Pleurodeles waltl]